MASRQMCVCVLPLLITICHLHVYFSDDPSVVAMVTNVVESVYGDTQLLQRTLSNVGQAHEMVRGVSMRVSVLLLDFPVTMVTYIGGC